MSKREIRRRQARRAVRVAVDSLESRRMLDASYFPLTSSNPFSENWTDITRLSTANATDPLGWALVPSIIGYRGDGMTGATAVNPQTVLGNPATPVVNIIANQTNTSSTSGGVGEFEIANPVVGFQGSGTARAPHLQIHLNTSGVTAGQLITVSYVLRDIDGTADNSVQPVALHYRIGSTGNWTNVPEAFVADASTGGSATQITNVSAVLPPNAVGVPELQLRIMTTDAAGSDEWIGVDDISVTAATAAGPGVFNFNPTSYSINETAGTVDLTVVRSAGSNGAINVNYSTVNGSAIGGSDFTSVSNAILSFADGQTTGTITLNILDDAIGEGLENFSVVINSVSGGATIGGFGTATVSIADNDATAPTGVVLNEIVANPADNLDTPREYVEIRGSSGQSIENLYFIVIEGDGTAVGASTLVAPLSGSLGSNGLAVLGATGNPWNVSSPGSNYIGNSAFDSGSGAIQNGSQTYFLVFSLTPPAASFDYDANDDGTLELPSGWTVLDSVGVKEANFGAASAGTIYGPEVAIGSGAADAISRLPSNTTPNAAAAWYGADLIDPDPVSTANADSVEYNPVNASANFPAGAIITPGLVNSPTTPAVNPGYFALRRYDLTVNENVGSVVVTIGRSGDLSSSASIRFETFDEALANSATPGVDYTSVDQVINFAAGQALATVSVPVTDDSLAEALERIGVRISDPQGATQLPGGNFSETGFISIRQSDLVAPTGALLNEISVNPGGNDGPNEYIEIRGTPGASLLGVYVLSIEGEGTTAGLIDAVFSLGGATIGSNGLLVIKSPASTLTFDAGSNFIDDTRLTNSTGLLENGSNSFLLVFNPDAVPVAGTTVASDIDTNNDGTIDNLPAGTTLLDGVGYIAGGASATDRAYGAALPEIALVTPDAVTRALNITTPLSATAWVYGDLAGPANTNLAYDATRVSLNAPVGAALTPGAANFAVAGDTTPPTLDSSAFNFLAVSSQNVTLVFSEDVGASVGAGDFTLTNLSTSSTVGVSVASVSGDGKTVVLEFVSTGNSLGSTILTDGNYRLTVAGGSILDTAGNALAADANVNFAFKNADFNGDLTVGFLDLVELSRNYGVPSGATFARGDANYDGAVNFTDLVALSRVYGTGLPFARANVIGQTGSSTTTSAARATSLVSSATPRSTGRGVFGSETRIV